MQIFSAEFFFLVPKINRISNFYLILYFASESLSQAQTGFYLVKMLTATVKQENNELRFFSRLSLINYRVPTKK